MYLIFILWLLIINFDCISLWQYLVVETRISQLTDIFLFPLCPFDPFCQYHFQQSTICNVFSPTRPSGPSWSESRHVKKKLEQKYGHSYFKSAFGINFGLWEVVKRKIRVFAYFPFDHFPKSKIDSKSRFEMRMSIFLFKKILLKNFGQYFKKIKKMDFPLFF